MHTEPRTAPILQVVVHVNVGPEVEGGARELATWLWNNPTEGPQAGGYHAVADDKELVVVQPDTVKVWGNGGINSTSLDVCIIGTADQTPAQWADPYSSAAIAIAATWTAGKCAAYGIPDVRLTPVQVAAQNVKGICGHVDVTAAGFPGSAGHYDPGPWFPWPTFLDSVGSVLRPPAPPNPFAGFASAILSDRVAFGDHGPKVRNVQRLLRWHGIRVATNGRYDHAMALGVLRFKKAHGIHSRDAFHVGVPTLLALLRKPKPDPRKKAA